MTASTGVFGTYTMMKKLLPLAFIAVARPERARICLAVAKHRLELRIGSNSFDHCGAFADALGILCPRPSAGTEPAAVLK